MPFARPPGVMVATDGRDELQFTDVVTSSVRPSLKVPVAVNACVVPAAIEFGGFTCIDTRLGTTVKLVDPVCPPQAAVIVALPMAAPINCPVPLTVATTGFDELQVAELVRSWLLPLPYFSARADGPGKPTARGE